VQIAKNISYGLSDDIWQGFEKSLLDIIENYSIKRICDIGGGANPVINAEHIKSKGLDYSILDISESELRKAPSNYNKIMADISSPEFSTQRKFDLMISKMLAEHVVDAEQFHKNVYKCLDYDGLALHFFPTLFTLPFFINFITPEYIAKFLLKAFAPRDFYQQNKFPAYYHWCRGPTKKQIKRFTDLGFEVIVYHGYFGHGYYDKIRILKKLHDFKTNYLLKHPSPIFTNFAYVLLKKKKIN